MGRLAGHGLEREGAPYDHNGQLLVYGGYVHTSGVGRARCQCGALSDVLPSGGARRRWHQGHKAEVAAATGKES